MKVILRADGNSATGLGHIMRLAAVMQILEEQFVCEFWTKNPEHFPFLDFKKQPKVKSLPYNSLEEEAMALASLEEKDTIIVLDGYQFKSTYQKIIKDAGLKLVCIDDIIDFHFYADVIINHAGGVDPTLYSRESYSQLYLGHGYSLIRPLFYREPRPERNIEDRQVFVSMGGADPANDTDIVLSKLVENSTFEKVHVVLGAANKRAAFLKEKYASTQQITFHENLTGNEMYQLMMLCPFAIITPSTICYEYMTIGGIVFLYQIADNQEHIKSFLVQNGLAFDFSTIGEKHDFMLSINRQVAFFDRRAPDRIRSIFNELLSVKANDTCRNE